MKDCLGTKIKPGDIVTYAARRGTRQVTRFAIIVDLEARWGNQKRAKAWCLDEQTMVYGLYRLKQAFHLNGSQVWVVKDTSVLPPRLVETLKTVYRREIQAKIDAEKVLEALDQQAVFGGKVRPTKAFIKGLDNNLVQQIREDIKHA